MYYYVNYSEIVLQLNRMLGKKLAKDYRTLLAGYFQERMA